ncbi:MAG: hypothetical protein M3P44_06705 [Actinomycetota bacterium]|nr:hypothetical protein [Actinomycetota bacterium]
MVRALPLVAVLALSACGAQEAPIDGACLESSRAIERALARAPAPVTLGTGTPLSKCISQARSDADLQSAGTIFTRAADELADLAKAGDAPSALQLGYLIGAARRGAARTAGIHAELQRRLERTGAYVKGPGVAAALARGLRAGERTG